MANLGELLAELRHDRGLKQEELADILHLSKSTISSYERGQQLPPLDKLVCLADFFHVTTDYLLGRCDVSVSPDSLNAELLPHKTAASVIRDIGNLSSEQNGNVKKCAVGKHPKSEKHGNTAQFSEVERSGTQENCGGIESGCLLRLHPLPVLRRRQPKRVACIDPDAVVVDKNIAKNDRFDLFSR